MKLQVATLLIALTSSAAFAQENGGLPLTSPRDANASTAASHLVVAEERPNALSLELLGRAGLYSIDYDYSVSDSVGVGVGLSYLAISTTTTHTNPNFSYQNSGSASLIFVPLYANYYFSPNNHRGFLSAGAELVFGTATFNSNSYSGAGALAVLGGGYEYRGDGGFLFRAAPYLFVGLSGGVAISAGLSVGTAF
jgi:hypothetical protein